MKSRHKLWRIALAACVAGALLVGASAAFAQWNGEDGAEGASDPLWEKLDALRAALAADVVELLDDQGVAETAGTVTGLLVGDAENPGVISLVQELAGVTSEEIGDPSAVVLAGNDRPEVLALAHLLLAAEALTNSTDKAALLVAGQHVEQANNLLTPLRPVEIQIQE